MPGTLISRSQPASWYATASISLDKLLDALIEPAPVASQVLDQAHHAWRQHVGGCGKDAWQLGTQETLSLPHRNAALQQEGADLIDDAGALADQPLPHPVQCLQVELFGGLGSDELHCGPLYRLGNCLGIAEVVLLSFRVGPHVLRRHQPGIVTKRPKPATEVMRTDAGLHADQTRRHIGKACGYLTA